MSDLPQSRERLMSAFEADYWARSEAMPSEDEIRRVRRLISRVKADLDDLSVEERSQIEEAVAVVRRGRKAMLGIPGVGVPRVGQPPWMTLLFTWSLARMPWRSRRGGIASRVGDAERRGIGF
ncbi:hypothetical protein ACWCOW_40480, partial [Streptomyces sp. NPDC001939]